MKKISVLLADDHPVILDGFRTILNLEEDIEVIGTSRNGANVLEFVREKKPDVILMDLHMPDINGMEATVKVKTCMSDIHVLLLTSDAKEKDITEGIINGASGFLLKDWDTERIVEAIRDCVNGQMILPTSFSTHLAAQLKSSQEQETSSPINWEKGNHPFNEREKQLLELLEKGAKNTEIAEVLFLSVGTVKNYLSVLYRKLGVETRTEAQQYIRRYLI
ncbi:response regulator [Salibacterium aidingense]|uniref:response regulator n=1 Tax=Salibacterium aidingense TaxID=384933 RepID=UPI000400890A|nr:response regulator transcription factor [Salibacterium aidingense]